MYSLMFSSARMGVPQAMEPTSGTLVIWGSGSNPAGMVPGASTPVMGTSYPISHDTETPSAPARAYTASCLPSQSPLRYREMLDLEMPDRIESSVCVMLFRSSPIRSRLEKLSTFSAIMLPILSVASAFIIAHSLRECNVFSTKW